MNLRRQKKPHSSGGKSHGAKFFLGGFEEDRFGSVCQQTFDGFNIAGSSRRMCKVEVRGTGK
jgi:hypothetical protein